MEPPRDRPGLGTDRERTRFDGVIRPLQEEDLPSIKPILEAWVRNMVTREILHDEVEEDLETMRNSCQGNNDSTFLVAEESGKIIGLIGMTLPSPEMIAFTTTSKPVEFVRIYVDPAERKGRGVGTALFDALEKKARDEGFTEIVFNSGPRYKYSGWAFHDSRPGFSRAGVAENLYGPRLDAPVWHKVLSASTPI